MAPFYEKLTKEMNLSWLGIAWLCWGCAYPAGSTDSPWRSVEKILGCPGTEQAGGIRIDFPRTDLNVTVDGIPLEAALAFTSRYYFKPLVKGSLLVGEMVVLDQESRQVTAQLKANGFQVSQPHDFLVRGSPNVKLLHIEGQGSRINLAMALNRVLTARPLNWERGEKPGKTPVVPTPMTEASSAVKPKSLSPAGDWERVEAVLGPGEVQGKVLQYEYSFEKTISEKGAEIPSWMGMETILRFQKVPGALGQKGGFWDFLKRGENPEKIAVVSGQLLVTPEQAGVIEETLTANQVQVAFQNDLESSPSVVILYIWGLGPEEELAKKFKSVLDQMKPDRE